MLEKAMVASAYNCKELDSIWSDSHDKIPLPLGARCQMAHCRSEFLTLRYGDFDHREATYSALRNLYEASDVVEGLTSYYEQDE